MLPRSISAITGVRYAIPQSLGAGIGNCTDAQWYRDRTAAHADSSTLYVDPLAATCSDAGSGTAATPYCSAQAAANAVNPGQTIQIIHAPAHAWGALALTRSGTPSQPITITGPSFNDMLFYAHTADAAAITITGVHDVVLKNFEAQSDTSDGIDMVGSDDITVDQVQVFDQLPLRALSITGASSHVVVQRSGLFGGLHDTGTESSSEPARTTSSSRRILSKLVSVWP